MGQSFLKGITTPCDLREKWYITYMLFEQHYNHFNKLILTQEGHFVEDQFLALQALGEPITFAIAVARRLKMVRRTSTHASTADYWALFIEKNTCSCRLRYK